MTNSNAYNPPESARMKERQNDVVALRLLLVQRRLYRRAKRWLAIRWLGMCVIGIGAPVISVLWPSLAVAAGATAGLWIFLGRTLLELAQVSTTARAASVHEQFDFYVFGMPDTARRSTSPSPEQIAAVGGTDDEVEAASAGEQLIDWYPIDEAKSGGVSVAVAQRANASYTEGLLRDTATAWVITVAIWAGVLTILSTTAGLSLSAFLLGIALPVLPAFLDVVQYVTKVWRSAAERRDLAYAIEHRLTADPRGLEGQDLLVWQERLFGLRCSAPDVPDFLYKLRRERNERAMYAAAEQIGSRGGGVV